MQIEPSSNRRLGIFIPFVVLLLSVVTWFAFQTSQLVMDRTNLFFKVEVEHDEQDKPERRGEEICRMLRKLYGVRHVELTNFTKAEG